MDILRALYKFRRSNKTKRSETYELNKKYLEMLKGLP